MRKQTIRPGVSRINSADWNRRLFDSLIPLPDGTSYNAYLVRGRDKTVLLDSADPAKRHVLMSQLEDVEKVDYLVAHHAEQDHSGSIPAVLEKYPGARVLATEKCKGMLVDHLAVDPARIDAVEDGATVDLGGKTLKFVHTPWVHWPETMCTYLQEDKILFSCDFFGSHLATTDLYVTDRAVVYEAAKRYYAEIMMPFRTVVSKNLAKLQDLEISVIAPSHGPVYDDPSFIVGAYRDWVSDAVKNEVVLPYISMHGSTEMMAEHLTGALAQRGVKVHLFDLAATDIGKLAIALVDAATLIVGTPTVHVGPHPGVFYAAHLANLLRPKLRYAAIINSYGWASKATEQISALIPNLKVKVLGAVLQKGLPTADTFAQLDALAENVAKAHKDDAAVSGTKA